MRSDYSALYAQCDHLLRKIKIARRFDLPDFHRAMEGLFQQWGFRTTKETTSILVLRLDVGGDNILTTPLLRELRKNHPKARITFVTSPAAYSLMELCPYADEVLCLRPPSLKQDTLHALQELLQFSKDHLWEHRCDICILPQWPSPKLISSRMLALISGARERWGYSDTVQKLYLPLKISPTDELHLLNHAISHPPEIIHEADRNLYLLEAMDMSVTERHTELWTSSQDRQKAKEIFAPLRRAPGNIIITLSTGAGDDSRKYPVKQWLEAMKEIHLSGGRFILIGGPSETEDGKFLEEHLPKDALLNLTGQTSLRESVAVIAESDLFMGNDSGMMHAAAACWRPIIAIYREAMDKEPVATGVLSEFRRFEPYMANYIALRPEHALGDCRKVLCYGGCQSLEAHCIRQVNPKEIIEAFHMITHDRR